MGNPDYRKLPRRTMHPAARRADSLGMTAKPHSSPAGPVVSPERSPRNDRLHVIALILPWALVALMWWRVLRPGPAVLAGAGLFVTTCAVLTLGATMAWITHNLAIHRAKGRRRGLPSAELEYHHDWTGRPVVADWTAVRDASLVFVAGLHRHKTFVPALDPARRLASLPAGNGQGHLEAAVR